MAQLRQDYNNFIQRLSEVVVIGPEDQVKFKDFWQKEKMPFPGIADPQHIIAKQYGQEVRISKLGRLPSLFVIDREGLVRFEHHGESMSDIPQNEDVLSLLAIINHEFVKR